MKKVYKLLFCLILLFSLFGCNNNNESPDDSNDITQDGNIVVEDTEQRKIYNLAVKSGYEGTYEEWLQSIRGDSIVLQVSNGYIQWKYSNESVWKNLISLSDLVGSKGDKGDTGAQGPQGNKGDTGAQGPQGEKGEDGKLCEFRIESDFIQWRYSGENDYSWRNLLSLSVLRGEDGENGENGKTPELRVYNGYIQWKYIGESSWTNLIDLASIGNGNGLIPEFSYNDTHILWKYTVENNDQWRELVSKDELKGESGLNGKTPEFREFDGYLQWKYSDEDDSKLQNVMQLTYQTKYINVTFDFGDGVTDVVKVESATNITPLEANKKGYKFLGWYFGDEEWKFDFYVSSKDITLTAKWEKGVTFSFETNTSEKIASQDCFYGDTFVFPSVNVIKENHKFIGWETTIDGYTEILDAGTVVDLNQYMIDQLGDLLFTAVWEKGVNVIFNTGIEENVESILGFTDECVTLPFLSTKLEGLNFVYWKDSDGNIYRPNSEFYITNEMVENGSDFVLTAVWSESINVLFVNNDEILTSYLAYAGDVIAFPSQKPSKENNVFLGWKIDFSNEIIYNNSFVITEEIIKELSELVIIPVWGEYELADGVYSFVNLSYEDKTEILGLLEKYAVENNLTGISFYETGGYVMYNDRITLGTENYITGFGFGILPHGDITADMASETNYAWKRYYHSSDVSDPKTANYLASESSQVADYYGYFNSSFFTTFMNATKDGYDWVPELAKAKPTPVLAEGEEADGMHTTWHFPVRVGSELKYSTLSKDASRAAYNNQEVVAEDYLTPFRVLLTQGVGYFRGSELARSKGAGAIKGAAEYYALTATMSDPNSYQARVLFEEYVGIKVYDQDGETWFEVEFTEETNAFYAMYYIASSLYCPFPMSFFELVGKDAYLGYNNDKSLTPVDNSLSLGAYTLEYWETDQAVAYKKNPNYVFADEYYKIPGVKISILKAGNTDAHAIFREFLDGNLDYASIPAAYINDFKNDPRTRITTGDSNFKLNVNALDAETWEYYFGVNGIVTQTPESEYWEVEPALSNRNFVKALSLSINRVRTAISYGGIPSVNFLSSNYMSDPENGISYNTTEAHKNAIAGLLEGTDGYGYSLELAREYFKLALEELVEQGAYTPGTVDNPTVIELEIAWQYPSYELGFHAEIKQYFETAFNHYSVHNGTFKLDVKFWVGDDWSDVYYKKMMVGQFDIGYGSVSGNPLNPLDFLSVLSADPNISGGFTLNWGSKTNEASDILIYDGKIWSYDALWTAANGSAIVKDGELVPVHAGTDCVAHTDNEDGTISVEIKSNFNVGDEYHGEVTNVVLYTYTDIAQDMAGTGSTYTEVDLTEVAEIIANEDGSYTVKVTLTVEQINLLKATHALAYGSGYSGIDIYFDEIVKGVATPGYASIGAEAFIDAPVA